MTNHIKYAISRYSFWLSIFATVIGTIAIVELDERIKISMLFGCFGLAFVIPLIGSYCKKKFLIKTIGKSKVQLEFGDLFDKECIVITTNRYYDINPTGEFVSDTSLLGQFVRRFCANNVIEVEEELKSHLRRDVENNILPGEYGESIKKEIAGKIVYFLIFTDRRKTDQPKDFYVKAVQGLFNGIENENHGKTICIPLLGNNDNLSESGFVNSEMSFVSLIAMINNFEIINQRSELKLKIVALPKERTELISVVSSYRK